MRIDQLSSMFSTPDKKINRKRALIALAIFVITSATFAQFIVEESIQMYNFGMMSLTMNDDWDLVREELPTYQAFHDKCQLIMYVTDIFNPITGAYFQVFVEADQKKIDIWERQVDRHDSRYREIVAGIVKECHLNGDGTAIITIDTGPTVEQIYVPFPEAIPLPEPNQLVQLECAQKYIRGTYRLELVRISIK